MGESFHSSNSFNTAQYNMQVENSVINRKCYNQIHGLRANKDSMPMVHPQKDMCVDKDTMIDAALLLTSVAKIASKEVLPSTQNMNDTSSSKRSFTITNGSSNLSLSPTQTSISTTVSGPISQHLVTLAPNLTTLYSISESKYQHFEVNGTKQIPICHIQPSLVPSRKRLLPNLTVPMQHRDHSLSHVSITPPESPSHRPRTVSASSDESFMTHRNAVLKPHDATARVVRHRKIKTILRKKFSWKNFPELESFLIANREEYLRHSTLNYTVQQKQYNNKLTERMIRLASEHGYIFDEDDFSFVTVRDRIRCYYKSYVQSLKKRGMIIGYAARKAGLVSEQELEQSAATAGKIIIP